MFNSDVSQWIEIYLLLKKYGKDDSDAKQICFEIEAVLNDPQNDK